jgi:hypothetical protein
MVGLHHHLSASGNFGQVIRKNYPVAIGNRMTVDRRETVSVVGPLCTPLDLLADGWNLPRRTRRSGGDLSIGGLWHDGKPAGFSRTSGLRRGGGVSAGVRSPAGRRQPSSSPRAATRATSRFFVATRQES